MEEPTSDPVQAFTGAIVDAGLTPPKQVIADGELHRFAPNGDRKDNAGWYKLHLDGVPAGMFGDWRTGLSRKWSAKGRQEMTAEERAEERRRIKEAKQARAKAQAEAQAKARERAAEIWERAKSASAEHPYLVAKDLQPPASLRQDGDNLVVPVRDGQTLHGLQFIAPDGDKKFLRDTVKEGCYCGFGKPSDLIIIAEGLATALSIQAATGQPVVVAFDAGNLPHVAKALRQRFPAARLIVCGDNDAHGKGQSKSQEAATAVDGAAHVPPQTGDDWNDVHVRDGLDAVRDAFRPVIDVRAPEPEPDPVSPVDDTPPPPPAEPYDDGGAMPGDDDPWQPLNPELADHFRAIGHNKGRYFFITTRGQQVIGLTATGCAQKANLFQLAPLKVWERWAMHDKGFTGQAVDMAANHIINACLAAGVYTPDRLRGRGAWWDEGRVILHCGDHLLVDGQPCGLTDVRSAYVYEAGPKKRPPARAPLEPEEGRYIYDLARSFLWENSLSGILLAGFVALARAGGALQWRPHIWLTGPRGCGKSVVLRGFVQALCGDWHLDIEGDATSAYVRQSLDSEAFAVTYDESEAKTQAGMARLQQVLSLVRSASREGGGAIGRGGQDGQPVDYRIRSCFAIASIYVNMQEAADFSRTSVLALKNTKGQSQEDWGVIERGMEWVQNPSIADGLFARTLSLLPVIRENQRRYAEALRKLGVGDQRFGDQIGTLLAGAHSLLSDRHVSPEAAESWIKDMDWTDYVTSMEEKDEVNCLLHLIQSPLQVETDHAKLTRTVGELLGRAGNIHSDASVTAQNAQDTLRRNGMRVDYDKNIARMRISVAQKHLGLSRIFRDTQFAVDYARLLKRLPFAWTDRAKPRFLSAEGDAKESSKSSAVFLMLEDALDIE